jgi:uncharacterized protein
MVKFLDNVRSQRSKILETARRRGVRNIRVFGSVARGEERADSDVDLLVELEASRSLFGLGGFLMDLHDLLGRKVDVATDDALPSSLRDRILREAIAL